MELIRGGWTCREVSPDTFLQGGKDVVRRGEFTLIIFTGTEGCRIRRGIRNKLIFCLFKTAGQFFLPIADGLRRTGFFTKEKTIIGSAIRLGCQ